MHTQRLGSQVYLKDAKGKLNGGGAQGSQMQRVRPARMVAGDGTLHTTAELAFVTLSSYTGAPGPSGAALSELMALRISVFRQAPSQEAQLHQGEPPNGTAPGLGLA